jgi:hypothetical protein
MQKYKTLSQLLVELSKIENPEETVVAVYCDRDFSLMESTEDCTPVNISGDSLKLTGALALAKENGFEKVLLF